MNRNQRKGCRIQRILGFLLALTMTLSLLPAGAFAADAAGETALAAEESGTVPETGEPVGPPSEGESDGQPETGEAGGEDSAEEPEPPAAGTAPEETASPAPEEEGEEPPVGTETPAPEESASPAPDQEGEEPPVETETPAPEPEQGDDSDTGEIEDEGEVPSPTPEPSPSEEPEPETEPGTLRLAVSRGGEPLETVPRVTLKMGGQYDGTGDVYTDAAEITGLEPGADYMFDLYDGGISHISGWIQVSQEGETVLTASFPAPGESWVKELTLKDAESVISSGVAQGRAVLQIPCSGGDYQAGFTFDPEILGAEGGNLAFMAVKDGAWRLTPDGLVSADAAYTTDADNGLTFDQEVNPLAAKNSAEGGIYRMRVFATETSPSAPASCAARRDENGYILSQDFVIETVRSFSLDDIQVTADGEPLTLTRYEAEGEAEIEDAGGFDPQVTSYRVLLPEDTLGPEIQIRLFSSLPGAVASVNAGEETELTEQGTEVTLSLADCEREDSFWVVTVDAKSGEDGLERDYTLYFTPGAELMAILKEGETVQVTIQYPEGVSDYCVRETTINGDDSLGQPPKVEPDSVSTTEEGPCAVYSLKVGTEYEWETMAGTYYYAYAFFTPAGEDEQTIEAYAPKVGEHWLQGISLSYGDGDGYQFDSTPYFAAPGEHFFTVTADSDKQNTYIKATWDGSLYDAGVRYACSPHASHSFPLRHSVDNTEWQTYLPIKGIHDYNGEYRKCDNIIEQGGTGAWAAVTVHTITADENGVFYAQDYVFKIVRQMKLASFAGQIAEGPEDVPSTETNDNYLTFTSAETGELVTDDNPYSSPYVSGERGGVYQAEVPKGTTYLYFGVSPITNSDYYTNDGCWIKAELDGEPIADFTYGSSTEETSVMAVARKRKPRKELSYFHITLDPEKSQQVLTVTIGHSAEGSIPAEYKILINSFDYFNLTVETDPGDACFLLCEKASGVRIPANEDGTYSVGEGATYTYTVSKSGYLTVREENYLPKVSDGPLSVTLEEAPESEREDISQEDDWTNFRGEDNNGVVDYSTPTQSEDAVLAWAAKLGEGWGGEAASCPVIVGGDLYCYARDLLMRLDRETGEILASVQMAGSSSFAIVPPLYADGMLIVGLDDMVQAFDAKTLTPLWLYTDPVGGQMNSTITYSEGYIYFGFWRSEEASANYVCLSITDEDPTRPDEPKYASWTYAQNGGFYWTGAAVKRCGSEEYVLVTTDDGDRGYEGKSLLLSMNSRTGALVDSWELDKMGDARSSISCLDGIYYFTTKGGYFCRFTVSDEGKIETRESLKLVNNVDNSVPMSTSTPVIANGRAYIGVSGGGQFVQYSGHNITVIDLDSFTVAYSLATQGYPQTSGLLTTAYTAKDGYNYVYFVDNFQPGKIRVIRDKRGMTEPDGYTTDEDGTVTAYNLFTPSGAQAQYAICSLIADSDGNIYFKNDSGYLMCLSPVITELTIETPPEKLEYCKEETFNPEGMKVTARYVNGRTKDVTRLMSYTTDPLGIEDDVITLEYDLGENQMMYQDKDGVPGTLYNVPTVNLDITIHADHVWDEGKVTKPATDTEEGEALYTCTICGATKSEKIPVVEEPEPEDKNPEPHTQHTWDGGRVTKAATAAQEGEIVYTCTVCGATRVERIPPLPQTNPAAGPAMKQKTNEERTVKPVQPKADFKAEDELSPSEDKTPLVEDKAPMMTDTGGLEPSDAVVQEEEEGGRPGLAIAGVAATAALAAALCFTFITKRRRSHSD